MYCYADDVRAEDVGHGPGSSERSQDGYGRRLAFRERASPPGEPEADFQRARGSLNLKPEVLPNQLWSAMRRKGWFQDVMELSL